MPSKSLDSVLRNVEKEIIIDALKSTGGNIAVAAWLLGTTERILGLRIKKYGFTPQKYRGGRLTRYLEIYNFMDFPVSIP